jgi:tyrosine-protein kinase Etk/Wzc
VADAIIAKFDLRRRYDEDTLVETRKHLARRTAIAVGKDLLIHVRVEDRDRVRAAEMANAYIEELHRQNSRLALTSAAQRRIFFEEQLRGEKDALDKAETAFKGEQQSSGLIYPSGQSAVLLRSVAELRAEISSHEVQAQSVRLYAGPENQELRQIEEGIAGLRAQLQKLEGSGGGGNGDVLVPAGKIPGAGLDYLRKMRDVKYHETLFELLSKQYEAARIDEARQSPSVQVVDRAEPADKKCWPPRALFIGIAAALAFIISSWFAATRRSRAYDRF